MINADQKLLGKIPTDKKRTSADIRENQPQICGNPPPKGELLYADITYKIRKAIFSVYNELGYGHKERVYQNALEKEFLEMHLLFKREPSLDVSFKGEVVGNYRPDFVIDDKVIIELKAVEFMPKSFETQLLHYLKTTGYRLGLLVNFGSPKLLIRRLVWTDQRKSAPYPRKSNI